MATRLKLNRVKLLEACRAALEVARNDAAQAQAELEAYDWRVDARAQVDELGKLVKDPESDEESFSDALYRGRRTRDKPDFERLAKRSADRVREIEDMIALTEIEVGDEITVSTSDAFIVGLLRTARRASQ